MCGSGARWCARADAIFDVPNMHVLEVEVDSQQRLVLTVESGRLEAPCPTCGVLAAGHGQTATTLALLRIRRSRSRSREPFWEPDHTADLVRPRSTVPQDLSGRLIEAYGSEGWGSNPSGCASVYPGRSHIRWWGCGSLGFPNRPDLQEFHSYFVRFRFMLDHRVLVAA